MIPNGTEDRFIVTFLLKGVSVQPVYNQREVSTAKTAKLLNKRFTDDQTNTIYLSILHRFD